MIIGWVIAAVVAVVVGAAAMMKQMQQKMQGKQAGMMIAKEGGSNPIKMVYGKRRIGTDNAWKGVSNYPMAQSSGWDSAYIHFRESQLGTSKKKVFLHRLDVWCQGPVHSIGNYKIDGDKTSHTRFANGSKAWARILTNHGNPNQTMFSALSAQTSDVDASMKGEGLAWSWSRFYYHDEKPEYQGEPNVTAEVQGLKVWDPRTNPNDPTVKSWSDNPALCLLDYLLADYGRELSLSDLDIPTFIAAANSCDTVVALPAEPVMTTPTDIYVQIWGVRTLIPVGGVAPDYRLGQPTTSRKRYTTNLILESDNSTIDNCAEILKTMKGSLPFVNGKYKLLMEEEGTSVMTFNDDNILGGVNLGWADRSKRTNRVTVKFPNENKGYQDDTVSWPAAHSALHVAYKAADNDEDLHSEFELIGVTDFYQARDMAEFAVRESRSQEYVTFKTQPQAMALECGDVITVSNDSLDIVNKLYRVRETSMNADLTVTVKAQIYDATIYPWSVGDEAAEAVVLNMTPSLFDQPAAMQNVTPSTATLLNDDGTAHTEVTVVWDEIETGTSAIDYVEIGYKLNADSVYVWAILPAESLSHTITGLQDVQQYNIAARYRNTVGKFSDVVVANIMTLATQTTLNAAAEAAQATADAAALEAAQALSDAAGAAADAAAVQIASQLYADAVTAGLQTSAQVQAAIAADTTVIDGARITTGTIAAGRISLSGKNISDLTNDSGFAVTTDIPDVTDLQTAAQVSAAIATDTTTIDGSRIVTGTMSAARISGGTLDFTNIEADNLFVSSISGDVNTLVPFKKQTTQTIPYLTSTTSFTIFEGTITASGSADILRKPYFSATGWGVFENDDVYKLELEMRVNDPSPTSTGAGLISSPTSSAANAYFPAMCSIRVPGNVTISSGSLLQDSVSSTGSSPRTLGSVWYSTYVASTNSTTIWYVADYNTGLGPVLSTAGRYAITPPPAAGYTLVNEFFFRSPFDYDPYQFAINGALTDSTQYSVDCRVKLRLFNQIGSGAIPNSQPSKNWTNDRIYNISGIMMSLR